MAESFSDNPLKAFEFAWLELTNRCNLQCVHCYAKSGPYEPSTYGLETGDWISILSEIRELGCKRIQFIGGEPLLYRDLRKLISHARSLDFEGIEVYTNGTHLTPNDIDFFQDHGVDLAFSFYSDNDHDHDSITTVAGSRKKTLRSILAALDRKIGVRVGVIQMRENFGSAERAVTLLRSRGVAKVGVDRLRGARRNEPPMSEAQLFDELCGSCWRGQLAINSAGDIHPCVFSSFCSVGNVRHGVHSALHSPALQSFRAKVREIDHLRGEHSAGCRPDESTCNPRMDCYPCSPQCNPYTCRPANCQPCMPNE
jgi:MoaA/NifB/PqqE/SkfB family radical SAM enzyme